MFVPCSLSTTVHFGLNLLVDVLDGVLDYPTWFQLVPAFQTSTGNLSALAEVILKAQGTYRTGLFGSGAFSENHDQPRFPSLTNDIAVSGLRSSR
jgi:alpha-amylase